MAGADIPSPLQNFVINNRDIKVSKQIGSGANGRILEAKWEGAVVAVKEIHAIFHEASESEFQALKRSFLQECEQSSRLRHPNIVRFFGIYYPPGARVPSLVMERLHCSLTSLLEQNAIISIETKLSIIRDVALGLRYLHTRTPMIIHRDLSSNNVLISKGMEGKIGDLGTVRFVDSRKQSRMTNAPGTIHFMPPEALAADGKVKYGKELDVFSFGCVMLHTLSHQWPTPSEPVVTNTVTFKTKGLTEVERRNNSFDKIDKNRLSLCIPMIKSCLHNIPKHRISIIKLCDQLEDLIDKHQHLSSSHVDTELSKSSLQQEIVKKDAEIQSKNVLIQYLAAEIETLKADMAKLHNLTSVSPKVALLTKQASKSSSDFWNDFTATWEHCADLPVQSWATSVAELDGKIYIAARGDEDDYTDPFMYDSHKNEWSLLPRLPYARFSLVAVPCKKQLLAIGGMTMDGTFKVSGNVFTWDENNKNWTTSYPNMPTARCYSSSISYKLAVIVVGGVTCLNPFTVTAAVEVLQITERSGWFSKSYWITVEQLPHVVREVVPLIIDDNLYITVGYDNDNESTCNIVTASVPELLQSNVKRARSGKVWNKLPDMPYSSWSISHFQSHLIIFNGDHKVEKSGQSKSTWELISLIHLYNPDTKSWDYVGDVPYNYLLGKSIHIKENKILFIGGLTGTHTLGKADDMLTTCSTLTLTPLK